MLDNKDIGFANSGQSAEIKIETFPFKCFGVMAEQVSSVSGDAVVGHFLSPLLHANDESLRER